MTWVKVCGLTRPDDVAIAVESGADAVGFIVAPESPRCIDLDVAQRLADGVPAQRVLVTVDLEPGRLLEAAAASGIDGVQPHGRHAAEAAAAALAADLFVLYPVSVGPDFVMPPIPEDSIPLFDTAQPDVHGGTGRTFDWQRVADVAATGRRFVLAGGLGVDNVASAVRVVRPFGVDASSRLEQEVGIKDHSKVAAFIREAKRA